MVIDLRVVRRRRWDARRVYRGNVTGSAVEKLGPSDTVVVSKFSLCC